MSPAFFIEHRNAFLQGLGVTAMLLGISTVFGLMLALPIALARVSRRGTAARLADGFVYLFRGTPLLTQLFLIYYGLAQFETVRDSALWPLLREPMPCAIVALSLNMAAYVSETLRAGILAVPLGEREAGLAAGMSPALLYRRIVLPRALRIALPGLGNELVIQLKSTAVVSTVTLLDVTGVARRIMTLTYSVDALIAAGILYALMTYAISRIFRLAERRLNRHLPA